MSRQPRSGASADFGNEILVPVSNGELIDKITILQIKSERLRNPDQLANVRRELAALQATRKRIAGDVATLERYAADIKRVNEALWEIEDAIRECDAQGDFGEGFIMLARSVYRRNDERARLKQAINIASGSRYVEEKSYKDFAPEIESRDPLVETPRRDPEY